MVGRVGWDTHIYRFSSYSPRSHPGLEVLRDRNGTFRPQVVRKGQRRIDGIEDRIIALYTLGLNTRSIHEGTLRVRNTFSVHLGVLVMMPISLLRVPSSLMVKTMSPSSGLIIVSWFLSTL